MLQCDFCGCVAFHPDKGWAGYHRDDPEAIGEPRVALFCPPCAAAMRGLLPEIAATYVRAEELRELCGAFDGLDRVDLPLTPAIAPAA